MRIVVVTGLAGAGKSNVLRALEDIDFFCCDNLPLALVESFVSDLAQQGIENVALSVDSRQSGHVGQYQKQVDALRHRGHSVEVLFIEANDSVLVKRYSETRRRHPLSGDDVLAGIARDREVLAVLREEANVLDTTGLNVHELKQVIFERFGTGDRLAVAIQSFGFKYGIPADCSLVFDVRFLPNPYFEDHLRRLDGRDEAVSSYVLQRTESTDFFRVVEDYLRFSLPLYAATGKVYATVGIGCTGGRHRSVAIAEELHKRLDGDWHALIRHRDLARGQSS